MSGGLIIAVSIAACFAIPAFVFAGLRLWDSFEKFVAERFRQNDLAPKAHEDAGYDLSNRGDLRLSSFFHKEDLPR